ncbi:endonuclease/exonuclease/phosphatase family protein [Aestuariivivens sediminicola]|uniref:endonuclease/exonuclease/phosphatase family protein n=1 Tax=Aestuariivivens sediminicola TaxID=2913560 RepID=UPI001F585FDD|nr:endonuclease/exonuclease/phosphatase family protein [Aestuariivivens sediminicola]
MNKLHVSVFLIMALLLQNAYAQEKKYIIHTIGFYNLENLFDTINDPNTFDEYSPIMEIKTNKSEVYRKKITNMAKVIADMGSQFTQHGPSLLGVAEIENVMVLETLVNQPELVDKDFGIIHFNSPDVRGIDVALLYQKKLFTPTHSSRHELKLFDVSHAKHDYTRDQLLVSGLLTNEQIHIIVNHWPSRRGGEDRSRYKRLAAAKLNKHIIDSLQSKNPNAKIVIMGDFNDDPCNDSFKTILKSKRHKKEVGFKGIYNPFENFFKRGLGTTAYRDKWSLFDQILITKPLLGNDYSSFRFYKAGIFNKDYVINQKGRYKGYPFRSFSNGRFTGGFSDHFPVYIYLIKEAR